MKDKSPILPEGTAAKYATVQMKKDACQNPKIVSRGGAENAEKTRTKGLKSFGVKAEILCRNLFAFDSLRALRVSA